MSIGDQIRNVWRQSLPNAFKDDTSPVVVNGIDDIAIKNLVDYNRKITQPIEVKKYTAEEVFEIISSIRDFSTDIADIYGNNVVKLLCLYFTCDNRFERYACYPNFSLNKGIALFGKTGVGKTMLMELFQQNMNFCYTIKPTTKIADEFTKKEKGRQVIDEYAHNRDIIPSASNFGQNKMGICFDDFGDEPVTAHYGDSDRVMISIMEARYRLGQFNSTHLTTNITADQIEDFYGKRVRSRMRQMFNVVDFNPECIDRRK